MTRFIGSVEVAEECDRLPSTRPPFSMHPDRINAVTTNAVITSATDLDQLPQTA